MRTRRLLHSFGVLGVLGVSMLVVAMASCGSSSDSSTTSVTPTVPDTTEVPTTVPDTTMPDTTMPDTTVPDTTVPDTTVPDTTIPAADIDVLVYFLVDEVLHVEGRAVTEATPREALIALLDGPTAAELDAGVVTLIPDGTELLNVEVVGDAATVDLSSAFESGGGSLSMIGRVAQIVFTVTQFDGIETVSFRLDGELITELGGEGIGVDAVQRLDNEYVLPFILPETPWPGQTVSQPIQVTGLSNVFEAQVNYEVFGPDGVILVEGYFMATSGTGTWGTFDATLDPLPAGTTGEVTVRMFEVSAENGDHVNVVDVTVQLA